MKTSARKKNATTQKFTQIKNIVDSFVFLDNGRACSVIEVTATNFALQSDQEQQVQISEYASFLNSLSFPIQTLIRSKKLDISLYLKTLDIEMHKTTNPLLQKHISWYKDFVANLIKTSIVLDKRFYIVIPFSPLELVGSVQGDDKKNSKATQSTERAKSAILAKQESIIAGLKRINLRFRVLEKDELIKLYYEIYNNQTATDVPLTESIETPVVRTNI